MFFDIAQCALANVAVERYLVLTNALFYSFFTENINNPVTEFMSITYFHKNYNSLVYPE